MTTANPITRGPLRGLLCNEINYDFLLNVLRATVYLLWENPLRNHLERGEAVPFCWEITSEMLILFAGEVHALFFRNFFSHYSAFFGVERSFLMFNFISLNDWRSCGIGSISVEKRDLCRIIYLLEIYVIISRWGIFFFFFATLWFENNFDSLIINIDRTLKNIDKHRFKKRFIRN